ncbi:LysR family transcriptional regulator [Acuticoccus sediminis]|uniref:LysR family transcriptional regulator n=1 Tax=Acuticoccus sediminis TaxID=2184697 RepID=A0A8B2NR54_9HYPH|nr:LysR family transcriptional regulator [Acuticoccus sediminis]RAI02366.1 LysR family transcriptional regulator [Acuticoccus sediminis]
MITRNLRHLRLFLAVADLRSVTRASAACHVSQPAVTQAIAKLEREAGASLFLRRPAGFVTTPLGEVLVTRVRRAFDILDPALLDLSPRLRMTATTTQLEALVSVREAENFTLAAHRMGIAQPTVHRAVSRIEREAGRPLFERTSHGIVATRATRALADAALLAFAELDQADADLAEATGREVGRIVIGAMPLSRSTILPVALTLFRARRPTLPVLVLDGLYNDLLLGLRRGEIDVLVGALRDPPPIDDVVEEALFDDRLAVIARKDHPAAATPLTPDVLAEWPWVVPRHGTPTRAQFDAYFGTRKPSSIIESGSVILMRELLARSDHLGCISRLQAEAEIDKGLVAALPVDLPGTRPIGLTLRRDWSPTRAQDEFLDALRSARAGQVA